MNKFITMAILIAINVTISVTAASADVAVAAAASAVVVVVVIIIRSRIAPLCAMSSASVPFQRVLLTSLPDDTVPECVSIISPPLVVILCFTSAFLSKTQHVYSKNIILK